MTRVLIADDDMVVRDVVRRYLERDGLDVSVAHDGTEALRLLGSQRIDVAVLDVMMPGPDGLRLCRSLRQRGDYTVPVILLTALGEEDDRIAGLEAGADDYVTKPVVPKELAARIRALLRRVQLHESSSTATNKASTFGDLELRREQGTVLKHGDEVPLTKTEFLLLCEFADHAGMVLSRDQLLERVWGYDYLGDSRLVDAHIRRLRVKIEDQPDDPKLVVTVRGIGYKLQVP
jgi:two-component system, OmpR family, response regulator ResD